MPGHTKFSPDWCFGFLKQETLRIFISSLFDIARSVEESATVNAAELVGLHNGTVLVPTYDRVTYLGIYFKKLPKIKSYYHFRFHADYTRVLYLVRSTGTLKRRQSTYCAMEELLTLESYCQWFLLLELAGNWLNICTKE